VQRPGVPCYGGAPDGTKMGDELSATTIVLCRPQDPGNIGSVCRAMKTMGITRLALVGPLPADMRASRVLAVHAADVLDAASRHETLEEALRGHDLVAGVTRREGRWRKQVRLTPEELAERVSSLAGRRVALVFGNEESGLSDEEMKPCHLAVWIPSSPLFPSLNLSHAVQVVAYALHRRLSGVGDSRYSPVGAERIESVTDGLMASLREAGIFSQGFEAEMRLLYRDILARAALSASEADRVERSFAIQRALIVDLRRRGAGRAGD
jgi:tRNA/rRNA methyltransferase